MRKIRWKTRKAIRLTRRLHRYWQRRWAAAAAAFALATALALSLSPFVQPGTSAAGFLQKLQPIPGAPKAPPFTLPDPDGELRKLSDWAGKVLVVNFWATWCPPCRKEMPAMERAWRQLKDKGVVFLAVHVGGGEDAIWTFLTDYDISFPVLVDKTGATSRAWGTVGLPTTIIVDPKGRRVLRAIGGREWDAPPIMAALLALK